MPRRFFCVLAFHHTRFNRFQDLLTNQQHVTNSTMRRWCEAVQGTTNIHFCLQYHEHTAGRLMRMQATGSTNESPLREVALCHDIVIHEAGGLNYPPSLLPLTHKKRANVWRYPLRAVVYSTLYYVIHTLHEEQRFFSRPAVRRALAYISLICWRGPARERRGVRPLGTPCFRTWSRYLVRFHRGNGGWQSCRVISSRNSTGAMYTSKPLTIMLRGPFGQDIWGCRTSSCCRLHGSNLQKKNPTSYRSPLPYTLLIPFLF